MHQEEALGRQTFETSEIYADELQRFMNQEETFPFAAARPEIAARATASEEEPVEAEEIGSQANDWTLRMTLAE